MCVSVCVCVGGGEGIGVCGWGEAPKNSCEIVGGGVGGLKNSFVFGLGAETFLRRSEIPLDPLGINNDQSLNVLHTF